MKGNGGEALGEGEGEGEVVRGRGRRGGKTLGEGRH